jgi:Nucleotide modification associated domain 2
LLVSRAEAGTSGGKQPNMSKVEFDIFIYKMVADNGGAPCVFNNVLSLAICKPKIRKSAKKGDIIFGFGGKEYGERLIYIARVTDKKGQDYYEREQYARRPDCIYRAKEGSAIRKASARYHVVSDHRKKDVGFRFENAFVLLSEDFRYLGKLGTDNYKHRYPELRKLIEGLQQGHRRHYSPTLREEPLSLKNEIWQTYPHMLVGTPSENDYRRPCNSECPSASC